MSFNIEQKTAIASARIEHAIKTYGDKIAVACSFGKDSIVAGYVMLALIDRGLYEVAE